MYVSSILLNWLYTIFLMLVYHCNKSLIWFVSIFADTKVLHKYNQVKTQCHKIAINNIIYSL